MSTRAFLGLLGVGGGKDADAATVSENELRLIIGSAKQSGAVEPDEQVRAEATLTTPCTATPCS